MTAGKDATVLGRRAVAATSRSRISAPFGLWPLEGGLVPPCKLDATDAAAVSKSNIWAWAAEAFPRMLPLNSLQVLGRRVTHRHQQDPVDWCKVRVEPWSDAFRLPPP